MTENKKSETTFKEYVDKCKEENVDISFLESEIISSLEREGFSEEEILDMPKSKTWKLYLDSLQKDTEDSFQSFYRLAEKDPAILSNPKVKHLIKDLKTSFEALERELTKSKT